ncbi:MAG: zinc ribbon domain-containing protein [Polyangiales bacterium]
MPTYSYRCSACNHTFDKVQRITEDAIKVCEACGAETATRLITSANFVLKGSGWYGDLYSGSSNKKNAAPSEAPASCAKPSGCDGACAAPAATTSSTSSSSSSGSSVN